MSFGHDALGNLSWAAKDDLPPVLRMPDAVGNLFKTVEKNDRKYGPAGQLLKSGSTKYEYDAEGNLTKKTDGEKTWKYHWNTSGMLAHVLRPDGFQVSFTYDALGRRLTKSYRGDTTKWVWDGNTPLHEWVEETNLKQQSEEAAANAALTGGSEALDKIKESMTTWLFEPESFAPLAKQVNGKTFGIITDHLGTPLSMHDVEGSTVWSAELNCYGQVENLVGKAKDCPFRYPGQYEDVETGLYYNRFRYYSPEEGIYLSQDAIGLLGGNKLYSYVKDNNIWEDPFGLKGCRSPDGRFQQAQTAESEIASLPTFYSKTRGNTKRTLRRRNYSKIKDINGDETWIRNTPDGKLAFVRLDLAVLRNPSLSRADERHHAHKEIANGFHIDASNGQGYTNGGIRKFDDNGNITNNPVLNHIQILN